MHLKKIFLLFVLMALVAGMSQAVEEEEKNDGYTQDNQNFECSFSIIKGISRVQFHDRVNIRWFFC